MFAAAVEAYVRAGWPCVLPIPPAAKHPPPEGYTGATGRDTDPLTLVRWASARPGDSIALRMPEGVLGIDVDAYEKAGRQKHGADTLAAAVERWGPLPPTWASTARDPDGPSGITFYRVPPGRYATTLGPDVEVIQRHHRYAVVAPSPHPETGSAYRWYSPELEPGSAQGDRPPSPSQLPWLPEAWVAGLAAGASAESAAPASTSAGQHLLDGLLMDHRPPCAEIHSAILTAGHALGQSDAGSRHDTAVARVHHLVSLAAAGHPGVGGALGALAEQWEALTAGEDRTGEWERMMLGSARKAVTALGQDHQVAIDPCLVVSAIPVAGVGPTDSRAEDSAEPLSPISPTRLWSVREAIGAHAFDPTVELDQPLAAAVLERTAPALRYAWDASTWLLRGPEVWATATDLAGWACAEVAELMPHGDPGAEKGSAEQRRAGRRARMMTSRGAAGVSSKMRALTSGGTHPSALRLADLDAEPEVLWAGRGERAAAYSLRASDEAPVLAGLDPGTPHLRSAAVEPTRGPTPLWDAFTAAVWPDPELRAWAIRVLSISLTGYPDAALPILLGPTGRGKTQAIHLVMSVLGNYADAASPKLLTGDDSSHSTIVYALRGVRLAYVDEGPREGRWAAERLKQLTGGTALTAHQMRQDPITFQPSHTLVLSANDEPHLLDPAVRRRVRLIPCDGDPQAVNDTRTRIGPTNGPAWRAEAPAVLGALMAEAAAWLADRSTGETAAGPEGVRERAELIAWEQDPVRRWVEDETEEDSPGTRSRTLFEAFVLWARAGNTHPSRVPTETVWGRQMTALGYPAIKTRDANLRARRLRSPGGWVEPLPPMPAAAMARPASPPVDKPVDGGGSVEGRGGSDSRPSTGETPGQTPRTSESGGCGGSAPSYQETRAPAHTHPQGAGEQEKPPNPPRIVANTGPDLHVHPIPNPPQTLHTPEPPSTGAESARSKRQATTEAKRAAAVEEASGPRHALPVVVHRDGQLRSVTVAEAEHEATEAARRSRGLTVDVETTARPVGHREHALRTVQLGGADLAVVLDPADPAQAETIRRVLAQAPVLHAHSATADLAPLAAAGLLDADEAWQRMADTAIPAKLADPANAGDDAGLKALSAAVLGPHAVSPAADEARAALFKAGRWLTSPKPDTPLERIGWAQADPTSATMLRYAAADVLDTAALAIALPPVPPQRLAREHLAARMTARVSHRGLALDGAHIARLTAEHEQGEAAAIERVRALGVAEPTSDAQVGAALVALGVALPHTPKTGRPSVAAAVLDGVAGTEGPAGELIRAVLDQRHHETALSLFLRPYAELVHRGDGRARPTVYTLGTDTGRMSCVRPNLQQLSRSGGVRACVVADPGQLLISADFSGVELRVAAALSGDASLRAIMADPTRDLHGEVAAQVFGAEWTKADRYQVKRGVFGRLYGGGVPTLARQMRTSESVAQSMVDNLDYLTPGLSAWSAELRNHVKAGRTRYPSYSGRVIYFPAGTPHKAPNYAIQGTARELLVDALERWAGTRWGGATLLPVHDELLVVVPEDEAEQATAALVECMTSDLDGVRIVAEPSAPARAWADSE